jgi:hypothetical protein
MNWQKVIKLIKSDYTKLILISGFVFYVAYIPNQNYSYPVHIDEWVHMAFRNEILKEESIGITYPFDGNRLKLIEKMELGFQSFLAITRSIT